MPSPRPEAPARSDSERSQLLEDTIALYGDALNREPAIAPRPARVRGITSLWRTRNYLRPYTGRFIAMVTFAVLSTVAGIVTPLVTRAIIDGPIARSDRPGLYTLGAFAIGLGFVEAFLMFMRRWVVAVGTLGLETGMRLDLYAKLQRLPMGFHSRWESGQLLSRIMSDLATIRRFFGFGLLMMILSVLQIVVVTTLLLRMYWPLGLVVVASVVPIVWLCLANERAYTKLSRAIQDQTGDVASSVEESVQGLRVVKAFGRGRHVFEGYDRLSTKLYDTSLERVALTSRFWTFLEVIPTVTMIIVLGMGSVAVAHHRLTLGTLVAFITLLLSLIWPVAGLGFLLSMTQDAMTAADRICEIFDA